MHVMYYFNILDNCPKRITMRSTGGATLYTFENIILGTPKLLGSYNLIRYDDRMNGIYGHDLKNGIFLYKSKDGYWFVRETLNQNNIMLMIHLLYLYNKNL